MTHTPPHNTNIYQHVCLVTYLAADGDAERDDRQRGARVDEVGLSLFWWLMVRTVMRYISVLVSHWLVSQRDRGPSVDRPVRVYVYIHTYTRRK